MNISYTSCMGCLRQNKSGTDPCREQQGKLQAKLSSTAAAPETADTLPSMWLPKVASLPQADLFQRGLLLDHNIIEFKATRAQHQPEIDTGESILLA